MCVPPHVNDGPCSSAKKKSNRSGLGLCSNSFIVINDNTHPNRIAETYSIRSSFLAKLVALTGQPDASNSPSLHVANHSAVLFLLFPCLAFFFFSTVHDTSPLSDKADHRTPCLRYQTVRNLRNHSTSCLIAWILVSISPLLPHPAPSCLCWHTCARFLLAHFACHTHFCDPSSHRPPPSYTPGVPALQPPFWCCYYSVLGSVCYKATTLLLVRHPSFVSHQPHSMCQRFGT